MAAPLLSLQEIGLTFGGTPLLTSADLAVGAQERLCLVGRNGSGKSTLLKIAAGLIEADAGERFVQPGATLRYLPQEPDLAGFATVGAYVEAGLGPGDDPYRGRYLLEQLGLDPDVAPAGLSGGETRRAALARTLAPEPDILLLDEPTNHLDLPAIEWLERELAGLRSALVLISHDRRFLERLSRATVWLDRGRTRRLDQGFQAFEGWRDTVLEEEERDRQKLAQRIGMEEHWLRYGVTARRKRNQRRVQQLADLRQDLRGRRSVQGSVKLNASEAGTSGQLIVEATRIGKAFGDRVIVRDFSTRIHRGDRVGFVGPNGAGKSTLLAMLTGALEPDSGNVRLGTALEIARLDQGRTVLDPAVSLAETLTGGRGDTVVVGGQPRHVVGYLKDFLFTPEQVRTPVGALSGGERGRLTLALALAKPSNLLVLDEPTNDLDLETLDLLQEMLADYAGTVLLVSHDRDFLDRTVSSVVAYEEDGRWLEYAGGYVDMIAQRGHGVAARGGARAEQAQKAAPAPSPAARPSRPRMSFKDKHALETLPGEIDSLRGKAAVLQRQLDDPGLYARDAALFTRTTQALADLEARVSAAEERWLELEMLREELEC